MGLFEDWQERTRRDGKQSFISFDPVYIDDFPFTQSEVRIIANMLVRGGYEYDPAHGHSDSGDKLYQAGLIKPEGHNRMVLTSRGRRIARIAKRMGY